MILDFWKSYKEYDLHPEDKPFFKSTKLVDINYEQIVKKFGSDLKSNRINENFRNTIKENQILQRLFAIPFVGDIENGKVFILYGNPGFHTGDFIDEYKNDQYLNEIRKNIKNESQKFFCTDEVAKSTGGYDYWKPEIDKLIYATQIKSKSKYEETRKFLLKNLVMVESLPYHSYKSPSVDLNQIPSAKTNKEYIHKVLLEKVKNNKIFIFAWRKVSFWKLPEHKNIISRNRFNSIHRFFKKEEIDKISNFLINN
jgi:hypothetical protein|tara:strand:+ start:20 stop:784 length:765 start_codon:yes stop_codon:yes gene_type:complete